MVRDMVKNMVISMVLNMVKNMVLCTYICTHKINHITNHKTNHKINHIFSSHPLSKILKMRFLILKMNLFPIGKALAKTNCFSIYNSFCDR